MNKMNLNRKIQLLLTYVVLQASFLEAKTELGPVVVTVGKTENNLKDISVTAEIITAQQIKQKGTTRLKDILNFSEGMYNIQSDKISNNFEIYSGVDNIFDKQDDEIPLLGMFSYIGSRYIFQLRGDRNV